MNHDDGHQISAEVNLSPDENQNIEEHWRTVQECLRLQCMAMPRGPWVKKLIDELDHRLRLHHAMQSWHSGLSRSHLLTRLRNLLALLPLDVTLQQAGRDLLSCLNQTTAEALTDHLASRQHDLVVVVTGCRSRFDRLKRTIDHFAGPAAEAGAAVIGVVGEPRLRDWEVRFERNSSLLSLPISDAYEALPQKVGWAALAVTMASPSLGILKVDDDAEPANLNASVELLHQLRKNGQAAAGYPITTPSPLSLDRGWHLGKSSRAANRLTFNHPGTKLWMSGGAGYLLAPQGVSIIAEHALHSWGFFQTILYEDICVSMLLQAADARLCWLEKASRLGISTERAREIAEGHWPYDRSMLAESSC